MKRVLFFLLPLISLAAFAQQSDTLYSYTNIGGKEIKKDKAVNVYRIYRRDSTSWIRTTSDRNLVMIKKETFADPELKVLNGAYIEYKNGKPYLKGYYLNNVMNGSWFKYDSLGAATESMVYVNNKRCGPFIAYWNNGGIKTQGNYSEDKKTDEWMSFYPNKKLGIKEHYNNDGKLTDSLYFDSTGKPTDKGNVITEPRFSGGIKKFYSFLFKNTKYSPSTLLDKIQGKIIFSFSIDTDGSVVDVFIISSPDEEMTLEIKRVLAISPKWLPGKFLGEISKFSYNGNMSFSSNF